MTKKVIRFAYFDETVIGKQFAYTYHEYDKDNQIVCGNISSSKSLDGDENKELQNLVRKMTNLILEKLNKKII